jgi:hypothetical protein
MTQLLMDRAETRPRNPVTPPPREKPRWLIEMEIAKAKAFAALSPEDLAEAKAAMTAARKRAEQRKKNTMALAKQIFAMHNDGRTVHEIAAAVERSEDAVIKFGRARGIAIPYSEKVVRRAVRITVEREIALRRMADDCGKTPAEALEDLIAFALDTDAAIARRTLRIVRKTESLNGARKMAAAVSGRAASLPEKTRVLPSELIESLGDDVVIVRRGQRSTAGGP